MLGRAMRRRVEGGYVSQARGLEIRAGVARDYADVFTPEAIAALLALRPLEARRVELMQALKSMPGVAGVHVMAPRNESAVEEIP